MSNLPKISTPPELGALQNQPVNQNLLLKTHFRFDITRIPNTQYQCQSANIPSVYLQNTIQPTMFNPIPRSGGVIQQEEFKIRFLVDEGLKNWNELFSWIKECTNYEDFKDYKNPKDHFESSATLYILENMQNPILKVTFENLFPIALSGIVFDSAIRGMDNLYATAEFKFTTFNIQRV